jgi:hypothetical protein
VKSLAERLSRRLGRGVLRETQVRLTEAIQPGQLPISKTPRTTHLDSLVPGEELLSLLAALDGRVNDDLLSGLPVDGGSDSVLVAELEGVDDPQDLGKVSAGRRRVGEGQSDLLGGVDCGVTCQRCMTTRGDGTGLTDEDGSDGERHALGIDVRGILVVQHVVGGRDRSVLVTDDGEL